MENNTIFGKISYWTLCTFIIIAIYFLVFGIFGVFILENDMGINSSIGLIIGSVGSMIVILALYFIAIKYVSFSSFI